MKPPYSAEELGGRGWLVVCYVISAVCGTAIIVLIVMMIAM